MVCDDTLFIKITEQGKEFAGEHYKEGYAYKGAKASIVIEDDLIENREWLSELVRITAESLPFPKPKRPRLKNIRTSK